MTNEQAPQNNSLLISYLTLRKWIGLLGICLPFVLIAGNYFFAGCTEIQSSISHYYYSIMGSYFTGTLCAVSLFLFTYNGYNGEDKITARLAAVFALGVAFFPTDKDILSHCNYLVTGSTRDVSSVHYISAALLFGCFAWFCLKLFVKTSNPETVNKRKQTRNTLYKTCGYIILACIGIMGAYHFIGFVHNLLNPYKPVLVLETIALIAFGSSWVVKGEMILKDK